MAENENTSYSFSIRIRHAAQASLSFFLSAFLSLRPTHSQIVISLDRQPISTSHGCEEALNARTSSRESLIKCKRGKERKGKERAYKNPVRIVSVCRRGVHLQNSRERGESLAQNLCFRSSVAFPYVCFFCLIFKAYEVKYTKKIILVLYLSMSNTRYASLTEKNY